MKWNFSVQSGMQITAMGLGQFGGQLAAIKYCTNLGAEVLVTDQATPELLADSVASLQNDARVSFRFGPHRIKDFALSDLIIVSPAVPPSHPCLQAAAQRGVPIITEIELFLAKCAGRIIAVSGTVGKSTTVTMIHHLLERLDVSVHLGGNIGKSLLPDVDNISDNDWVILELSSFQLHWLARHECSFDIAVLTNYFPHHLDWHDEEQQYRDCKQILFRDQNSKQLAVRPIDLQEETSWNGQAKRIYFGQEKFGQEKTSDASSQWPAHIERNAQAAIVVVESVCQRNQIETSSNQLVELLADFQGLPHRMQRLPEKEGRTIFNDSKATSPQATIAAVDSIKQPTWLIVGGAPIKDDLDSLIFSISNNVSLQGIACVGETGKRIDELLSQHQVATKHAAKRKCFSELKEAVRWCWENSQLGETILLSPACPSYDEFMNYEQRGLMFAQYIEQC